MEQAGTHNTRVLEIARSWIGTPYRHQGRMKGAGCDCIGLIIGVWEELYGSLPKGIKIPAYTPAWAEETRKSLMVAFAAQYLEPVPLTDCMPGDVLMFSMLRNGPTKHAGLLSGEKKIIHAYQGHAVAETDMNLPRYAKLTYAFRYPEQPITVALPWQS